MKHGFSKAIVLVCIAVSLAITIVTLYRAELTSGVLTALYGFWGGELLLLCLKRIFGEQISKSDSNNANYTYNNTEDTI